MKWGTILNGIQGKHIQRISNNNREVRLILVHIVITWLLFNAWNNVMFWNTRKNQHSAISYDKLWNTWYKWASSVINKCSRMKNNKNVYSHLILRNKTAMMERSEDHISSQWVENLDFLYKNVLFEQRANRASNKEFFKNEKNDKMAI